MFRLVLVRSLVLVLFSLVVLGGCSGGSGGEDSEHGLVPTPETHVTDTNTTPDANGTQPDDSNGGSGGSGDDGKATGGGDDTNASTGGTDTNGTAGGSDDGNTTGGGSNDGNTTGGGDANTTVSLIALKLSVADTTLNKDHNTTVTLTATYSDHTTKPLTSGITWIITPSEAVTLHGTTLTALKDTNVTVQAKVGTTLSNTVNLNIYWEVNGHRLPPEPDPKVNDATLLGVDVNKNGVRDDVERWIYETYKEYIPCHQELDWNNTVVINGKTIPSGVQVCEDKPVPYHPVVRAVAMQGARAAQIIIQHPEKAQETLPVLDRALNCDAYITTWSRITENKIYTTEKDIVFSSEFKKIQFNTVQRARAFGKFNFYLSGGVYSADETSKEMKEQCSDEAKKYLKDLK